MTGNDSPARTDTASPTASGDDGTAGNVNGATAPESSPEQPSGVLRFLRPVLTLAVFLGLVALIILRPDEAGPVADAAKRSLTLAGHSPFLLLGVAAVAVATGLIFSPIGARRLGPASAPALGGLSWFCLAFSAGTLSGLTVWAAAEPLYHLLGNPLLAKGEAETAAATAPALRLTNFHWALHPWAIFALMGVAIGWGAARYRLPVRPSSALAPFFGRPAPRWLALPTDIIVVLVALLAALVIVGMGVLQADTAVAQLAGYEPASVKLAAAETAAREAARLSGVDSGDLAAYLRSRQPDSTALQVALAAALALVLMLALAGLRRALRPLCWLAAGAMALLVVALFVFGPAVYIMDTWIQSLGDYLTRLPILSFMTEPNKPADAWQGWWTAFYLGSWLAMAPLVGGFLAAISRGRTVRAVLIGGFVAPALATTLIVSAMGGTALWVELFGDDGLIEPLKQDPALAVFEMLRTLAPAEDGGGAVALLPGLAAVVQVIALLAVTAAAVFALHNLFQPDPTEVVRKGRIERDLWRRQIRRGAGLYVLVVLSLGAAAIAVWAVLGAAGWSILRAVLYLGAVPAGLFLVVAVIALLRPVGAAPATEADAD